MILSQPVQHCRFYLQRPLHLVVIGLITMFVSAPQNIRDVMLQVLADAYLGVTVFVAFTYGLFLLLEHKSGWDVKGFLHRHQRWQPLIAAVIGALPGCGGAVVVISQYVRGHLSFGAMVAVLTATMGDAAFLLIASQPLTGLGVMIGCTVIGTVMGMIVDRLHGTEFLRMQPSLREELESYDHHGDHGDLGWFSRIWYIILTPGILFGFASAMQIDTDAWLGFLPVDQPTHWLGVIGGVSVLMVWLLRQEDHSSTLSCSSLPPLRRTVYDTNFITIWVVLAFLSFELAILTLGVDLRDAFSGIAMFVPLIAVLVGLVPGCGPQILVTTFYVQGEISLSAQIGNAISNDGDALFPALALAPKAALLATLYSTIPAVIAAYSWMILFE